MRGRYPFNVSPSLPSPAAVSLPFTFPSKKKFIPKEIGKVGVSVFEPPRRKERGSRGANCIIRSFFRKLGFKFLVRLDSLGPLLAVFGGDAKCSLFKGEKYFFVRRRFLSQTLFFFPFVPCSAN